MTTAGALPRPVTEAEWEADWSQRDENYELVNGIPTMAPGESFDNRNAVTELLMALRNRLPHPARGLTDFDVRLCELPLTVRRPDVVVVARPLPGARHALPNDVLLVAEFVSPSSVEVDWIHKRAEYARAGIPAYLVVDLRPEAHLMALFTDPSNGTYRDPLGENGEAVTLDLLGERVTIRLEDLNR